MSFSNNNELLDKHYCKQFNYNKLLKMIKIFISLIRNLQLELGDLDSIKITAKYEMRYSNFVSTATNSVIESFLIKDYKTEQQMNECISMFVKAYNNLSNVEKEVFYKVVMHNEKEAFIDLEHYYKVPFQRDISHIKQSAIIKFATFLRFHRMMDKVLK